MTALKQTALARSKPTQTTFMKLLQELSELTNDDRLVIAAVRSIFETHKVRLSRSLTPVKLVG